MYLQGQNVTPKTNSLILLAGVIPMSIIILIAPALSNRFGYEFVIKVCAFVFLLSPQALNFGDSLILITVFAILLPATAFAVSTIPIFNCMWTQFPLNKNTITSLAVTCFAVGTIFWNFLFTIIVNPHNLDTEIYDESTGMGFFGEEVSSNVMKALIGNYTAAGFMFTIGSFLIKKRKSYFIF